MIKLLETPQDMAWLADVHTPLAAGHAGAILYGTEDSPHRVELYARNHVDCKPTVLVTDGAGPLVVIARGEPV